MSTAPPILPGIRDLFPDHLFDAAELQNNARALAVKTARSEALVQSYPSPNISPISSSSPSSLSASLSTSPGSMSRSRYQHTQNYSSETRHSISEDTPMSLGLSLMDRRKSAVSSVPPQFVSGHRSVHSMPGRHVGHGSIDSSMGPLSPHGGPDAMIGIKDGKRHTCPHCGKRFNRPSSLGIHINTHTGVKPFECPFVGCGRQFNVSSNMRRHYRNHSAANASNTPSDVTFLAHSNLIPSGVSGVSQSLPTSVHWTSLDHRLGYSRNNSSELNPAGKHYPYPPSSTASYPSPSRSELSLTSEDADERELDAMSESSVPQSPPRSRPYSHSYAGGPERTSHVRRSSASSTSPYMRYAQIRAVPSSGAYSQEPVYTFPPPPPPPSSAMPMTVPSASGRRYSGTW